MRKNKFDIAGLGIEFSGNAYDYLLYRLRDYISDKDSCDIKIAYSEASDIPSPDGELKAQNDYRKFLETDASYINYDILEMNGKNTALITSDKQWKEVSASLYDVEDLGGASLSIRSFNMLGEILKYAVIKRNGFVIHSSSIAYKDNGILFSAPSGTGKSTHTGLWEKVYKEDVEIINDDMPVIRKIDGIWKLCGTPWSGKSERNINKCVPLKAIVFLERGEKNLISRITLPEAMFKIMQQTLLPVYKEMMEEAVNNISEALSQVPCYILKCNISEEAPRIVKEGVFNENQ